ncbi:phage tail sheath family protein [Aneurinibacillus migulanus]|uniref:Phage tail sheath protein n=1 Tax=Aneurinibacillus migulanus TaxID=47500 RepID=A0A0D1WNL8_ANEMI|nr:phage tail sheath family protein [Aneurinibacillus migulanus]KIV60280.1 hypothetical protein TS65_00395 [Aneurinibacillus migulanus]KON90521.1 hypothetical protein AF333_29010 [Aneurinibacillus migulanus]MED0894896.1 phage tail sheath family protein [Aneurinibacillus migulanus]MED1614461.1 phage tail sheath family protein [Aneurinibacillus migulanus]SDJ77068.1 Phage tail sheath protein [Aneurinibacillus migulanus]
MAGGTFQTGERKVRPGFYARFISAAQDRIAVAPRGTVILPLTLNWGRAKEFTTIEVEKDTMDKLGYDYNDPEMLLIREARKLAKKVKVYKLNKGEKAKGTFGTTSICTVEAINDGTRGNDITIVSQVNVLDTTKKDVITYVKGRQVDKQTQAEIESLVPNEWVTFSGTGAIEATAGTTLTGGTNGTVINADYTDFMTACETEFFDTIGFLSDDVTLKTTFVGFIRRLREDEGRKVKGVVAGYEADYEGIINVKNSVKLLDGTELTKERAVAWVAGADAGASITKSNTYQRYDGAVDAIPRYTNSEIIEAINKGEFVFVNDGEQVKVEYDINSLVTTGQDKNSRFKKNRVMRTLDAIHNDIKREIERNYIGKMNNNADGQAILKASVIGYLETLQNANAIQNLDKDADFVIDPVLSVDDEVHATIYVQPVDSMEKFYFTILVR